MEKYLYGRLSILNRLNQARNDWRLNNFNRLQADRSIRKILNQLKDKKLMSMRERLIKATCAGDLHEVWKIENMMRLHERRETEEE